MSQIVFHGDSWTWGCGLQYYYLKEKCGYSDEDLQNFTPDKVRLEKFSRKVDDYRKKYHYPNLVSKHFDVSYVTALEGNGGDNQLILENIKNTQYYHFDEVQSHIVQLSAPMRGPNSPILQQKNVTIEEITEFQIEEIIKAIERRSYPYSTPSILFICWYKEHSEYIKKKHPEKLIPILYKNKEYNSFDALTRGGSNYKIEEKLQINNNIEIDDGHFSKKGHKMIANSVIKKLSENIKFNKLDK
jgi:hypothetical protein